MPDRVVDVPVRDLHKGRNLFVISKSGPGSLYYSYNLTQYIARRLITAVTTGSGVTITRRYYKPSKRYYQEESISELGSPITSCDSSDLILVELTVHASRAIDHMLVEDFIPAGCEIVDTGHIDYSDWNHDWVGQDVRDERVSFYVDELNRGNQVFTYQIRAGAPGVYTAMPAQVFAMYDPTLRSTTQATEFEIR